LAEAIFTTVHPSAVLRAPSDQRALAAGSANNFHLKTISRVTSVPRTFLNSFRCTLAWS